MATNDGHTYDHWDDIAAILRGIDRGFNGIEQSAAETTHTAAEWERFWEGFPDGDDEPDACTCGDNEGCTACAHEPEREPLFGLTFTITALEQVHPANGGGCLVRFTPNGKVSNHWGKRVVAAKVEYPWEAPVGDEFVLIPRGLWERREFG